MSEITQLLDAAAAGDRQASADLLPLVYDELRKLAAARMAAENPGHTLDATALVHEAYLRLFDRSQLDWHDRRHFYSVAAIAMRQIIVDHARRRAAAKRGGGLKRVDLDASQLAIEEQAEEIVALNQALSRLAQLDERLARVVELRFFAGLSVEEVALVMETSERTVKRDWRKACALLYQALRAGEPA